jgi:hypothetical protein
LKGTRVTLVTGYEVNAEVVAEAMLRDTATRRLIATWLTGGARSREDRGESPRA